MRIGIAGFMHESNTFTKTTTTLQHFQDAFLHYGEDLIPVWQDAHHELGGFIAGCRENDLEMVPLLAAWATPHGPLRDEAYERIVGDLLARLAAAAPLDGLLLALHGAMVSESYRSADSETLRRVRAAVGPHFPLILSLDMHANVAPEMAALPTATIVYRTYPHVDQRARGVECAHLMARILRERVRPVQAHVKLPLLMHIVQQYTGAGPLATIFAEVERLTQQPGILSASLAPGYIYADSPYMGTSVIVVADGDWERAESEARRLAQFVFDKRLELNAALPDVPTAVAQARAIEGTVCLMDCGDNIGAGGPGDSTIILEEILKQHVKNACAILYDPAAAQTCAEAGTGAQVSLQAGGKTDHLHGRAIPLEGRVLCISDGRFTEHEARHGGMRDNQQGLTAVVETSQEHTIVLNSLRIMPTSLQQLLSLGIAPAEKKVIIVKGVTAPRAAYEPIAAAVIPVDSSGITQAGPESFHYSQRPRPLFPLEQTEYWLPVCT